MWKWQWYQVSEFFCFIKVFILPITIIPSFETSIFLSKISQYNQQCHTVWVNEQSKEKHGEFLVKMNKPWIHTWSGKVFTSEIEKCLHAFLFIKMWFPSKSDIVCGLMLQKDAIRNWSDFFTSKSFLSRFFILSLGVNKQIHTKN